MADNRSASNHCGTVDESANSTLYNSLPLFSGIAIILPRTKDCSICTFTISPTFTVLTSLTVYAWTLSGIVRWQTYRRCWLRWTVIDVVFPVPHSSRATPRTRQRPGVPFLVTPGTGEAPWPVADYRVLTDERSVISRCALHPVRWPGNVIRCEDVWCGTGGYNGWNRIGRRAIHCRTTRYLRTPLIAVMRGACDLKCGLSAFQLRP
jgi:hypothetical protein